MGLSRKNPARCRGSIHLVPPCPSTPEERRRAGLKETMQMLGIEPCQVRLVSDLFEAVGPAYRDYPELEGDLAIIEAEGQ